jgi:carboxymethylenebutenolidase
MKDHIHAAGREVTFFTYPGVGHWFFEANRPNAYSAAAVHLAWERTVDFLQTQLSRG